MKACFRCKEVKQETEFHKNGLSEDGFNPTCKACRSARRRQQWKDGYGERAARLTKNRRRCDPRRALIVEARARAKKSNIQFELTVDDIKVPAVCPVLGISLSVGSRLLHDGSPSLDRRDNQQGYTASNTLVISLRANRIKNDATPSELERVLRYVQQ